MLGDKGLQAADKIIICVPIFNDWECARLLLEQIDEAVVANRFSASVLFVDDGSTTEIPEALDCSLRGVEQVEVLKLRKNVGHQRAIALGLTFICSQRRCNTVIVMDGDGEDSPAAFADLLQCYRRHRGQQVVFAQRARRSEGLVFRIFYQFYKLAHRLLTGRPVDVGNFSVIPARALSRLVGASELWNHYAASVVKNRLLVDKVPIPRAHRLMGESKMNFVSLVTHGLSAISVFGEQVYTRLLVGTSLLAVLVIVAISLVVAVRLGTDWAIPGWTTFMVSSLAGVLLNSLLLSLMFIVSMLQARDSATFLPIRDYRYFIGETAILAVRGEKSIGQEPPLAA